jgi:outer membrane protein assembly factor BamB
VGVGGSPLPSVQWQIAGGADLADGAGSGALAGATISGATTTSLTLTNVPQAADGLQLAARVSNSAGSVTSSAATLTVTPAAVTISATAGGTAISPDGMLRVIFPPNAFTADSQVTFTAVPAPTLPSGTDPFSEDFASFQPVQGSYYRLDFSGGLLKQNVTVEYGLRAQPPLSKAKSQRVRAAMSPPSGRSPRAVVLRCSDGRTELYMGAMDGDYDSARAMLCGGDPAANVTVGPATLVTPPSGPLSTKTLARPFNDVLNSVFSFNNGRSAFGFSGQQQSGNVISAVNQFAVVTAAGTFISSYVNASLLGFDGFGTVLTHKATGGCSLSVFDMRLSGSAGAHFADPPRWTTQLVGTAPPTSSCFDLNVNVMAAAPAPGGAWIVASTVGGATNLDRYFSNGFSNGVATALTRWNTLPFGDIRRHINYKRLAVDSGGNIWGFGYVRSGGFSCSFSSFGPCAAVVKLDPSGNLLGSYVFSSSTAGGTVPSAMGLTIDSAGNVWVAAHLTEFVPGSATYGQGRITLSRIDPNTVTPLWNVKLSDSNWNTQMMGEIAVNPTTGQVFVGTAPNGLVYRVDASSGTETGKLAVGAPYASSVISGLSIDASGTLTFIGDLSGTLQGTTSAACSPTDFRPCTDVLVRRFNF